MEPLRASPFTVLLDRQLDDVRAIYEDAFPAWQRVPFEELGGAGDGRIGLAEVHGATGRVVAFAAASRLASVPWTFLEYFAVAGDRRGGGIGTRLWQDLLLAVRADPAVVGVVLEVENTDENGIDGSEREIRHRRVRFYERLGARLSPFLGYEVPRLDRSGTERLLLMTASVTGAVDGAVPGPALAEVIRALYIEGYGLAASDELVRSATEAAAGL